MPDSPARTRQRAEAPVTQSIPPAPIGMTYRDAGVDIDAGNEVVERIKPLVRRTLRPEVLGGVGLFGGRGGVWSALLGIFVIQSISNGMDLLSLDISIKLLVTGAVLLLAVTFDAVTRTQRSKGTGNIFARLIGRRPTS